MNSIAIPSEKEIYELHKKICPPDSPELLEMVWTHCVIVKEIAMKVVEYLKSKHIDVNKDLVAAGALLHDMGVYRCVNNQGETTQPYIRHGEEGEKLLLDEGLSYQLARFASHHTGVGITLEEVEQQRLPIGKEDWIPVTLEEEVVAYADKYHSKHPSFNTYQSQEDNAAGFNPDHRVRMINFKKKFGIPDISDLQNQYAKWQAEFKWGK